MARWPTELVRGIPGYISHKGFVADDGERVTGGRGNQFCAACFNPQAKRYS